MTQKMFIPGETDLWALDVPSSHNSPLDRDDPHDGGGLLSDTRLKQEIFENNDFFILLFCSTFDLYLPIVTSTTLKRVIGNITLFCQNDFNVQLNVSDQLFCNLICVFLFSKYR